MSLKINFQDLIKVVEKKEIIKSEDYYTQNLIEIYQMFQNSDNEILKNIINCFYNQGDLEKLEKLIKDEYPSEILNDYLPILKTVLLNIAEHWNNKNFDEWEESYLTLSKFTDYELIVKMNKDKMKNQFYIEIDKGYLYDSYFQALQKNKPIEVNNLKIKLNYSVMQNSLRNEDKNSFNKSLELIEKLKNDKVEIGDMLYMNALISGMNFIFYFEYKILTHIEIQNIDKNVFNNMNLNSMTIIKENGILKENLEIDVAYNDYLNNKNYFIIKDQLDNILINNDKVIIYSNESDFYQQNLNQHQYER